MPVQSCFRIVCLIAAMMLFPSPGHSRSFFIQPPPVNEKSSAIHDKVAPALEQELRSKNLRLGNPVFIRIFKFPGTLEVWVGNHDRYQLFKSYSICNFSGHPGPKLQEGDWQTPEGFYTVTGSQMNPWSEFHLSFDIGYPNVYDAALNRTGNSIMVHGGCSSVGCFAMGNYGMEEIYTLAGSALENGQEQFSVHIFPFVMTDENLRKYKHSPWFSFWNNLKKGYDAFERSRKVPLIMAENGEYRIHSDFRMALSK